VLTTVATSFWMLDPRFWTLGLEANITIWPTQGIYIFSVLGLELRAFTLSHSTSYFCEGFFEIGSHGTISPGWLWTMILLISASWVARITTVSHWHPAHTSYLSALHVPTHWNWMATLSIGTIICTLQWRSWTTRSLDFFPGRIWYLPCTFGYNLGYKITLAQILVRNYIVYWDWEPNTVRQLPWIPVEVLKIYSVQYLECIYPKKYSLFIWNSNLAGILRFIWQP
jgi:hypothetical protein